MRPVILLVFAVLAVSTARAGLLSGLLGGNKGFSFGQRNQNSNFASSRGEDDGRRKKVSLFGSLGQILGGGGSKGEGSQSQSFSQGSSQSSNDGNQNNAVSGLTSILGLGQQQASDDSKPSAGAQRRSAIPSSEDSDGQIQSNQAATQAKQLTGGILTEKTHSVNKKSNSESRSSEKTNEEAVSETVRLEVGSAAKSNDQSQDSDDDNDDDQQNSNTTDKVSKKKKTKKGKVRSSQSIRILIPGRNPAGTAAAQDGNYSKKTQNIGQSMSKHRHDEREDTIARQLGTRTDSTNIATSRHVGVDAKQNARITSDSTGMHEILLTQDSLAQKKKTKAITKTTGTAKGGEGVASLTRSSRKKSSVKSASSQNQDETEEKSTFRQTAI